MTSFTEGAAELRRRHGELHRTWARRGRPGSESWDEWVAAAAAFRVGVEAFYAPVDAAIEDLRAGQDGFGTAFRFLEDDPWCYWSGFTKARLFQRLANHPHITRYRARAQAAVVRRIAKPEPDQVRRVAQLAAAVWDDELARAIEALAAGDDRRVAGTARDVLRRVGLATGAR